MRRCGIRWSGHLAAPCLGRGLWWGWDVHAHAVAVEVVAADLPLTAGGRFGRRGKNTQVVESGDPAGTARQFWAALSKGGQIGVLPSGKGDIS